MAADNTLRANNLRCVRQHKELFTHVSFELNPGNALLIEGPNGSGKSSLLRLLTGLSTPLTGDIFWQASSIHDAGSSYFKDLHFVGHLNGIKLGLTVTENLQLACHLSSLPSYPCFKAVLDALQLTVHAHTLARYLSAGQKRRLGLAKLFLFQKPLWILDEPLTALDVHTQALFLSWLETHLHHKGLAIISSHHPIALHHTEARTLRLSSC